jgi:CTP-dependent riboflavin kinase
MKATLCGRVQPGKGDASRWLGLFNAAYSRKLGCQIYPGSLNLALDHEFNWFDPAFEPYVIWFGREEYGGERDILFLECTLHVPDRRKGWLWAPTTAARSRADRCVVELVSDVRLRDTYELSDGATVEMTLCLGASEYSIR